MDLRTSVAGITRNYFWYKSKLDLIKVLFDKVCSSDFGSRERKILNIGIGTGDDLSLIQKYGKVFAIDTEAKAIDLLPPGICHEKKVCSACIIDYPDNYFDVVTAFDTLEHIDEQELAIREISRVLKPEGFLLFTVPAIQVLYSAHDRFIGHMRRYNMTSIKNLLLGLRCRRIGYWMFLFFLPIAFGKLINKKGSRLVYARIPSFINSVLYSICLLEVWFIKNNFSLPIGTTIYRIYQKK